MDKGPCQHKSKSKRETEGKMNEDEKMDVTLPWGVYIPPSIGNASDNVVLQTHEEDRGDADADAADVEVLPINAPHGGYIQIVDAKGKFFPCGFSRPIGVVLEETKSRKRSRSEVMSDVGVDKASDAIAVDVNKGDGNAGDDSAIDGNCISDAGDGVGEKPVPGIETKVEYNKITITEERLHPEEALFLHLRGLLRIQTHSKTDPSAKPTPAAKSTMSTQDLFCNLLPECNIPLGAYLAYAHLRAQGYNLIRYTDTRMKLLRRMHELELKLSAETEENDNLTSIANQNEQKYVGEGVDLDRMSESIPDKDQCIAESQCDNTDKKGDDTITNTEQRKSEERLHHMSESVPDKDVSRDEPQNEEKGDDIVSMNSSEERIRTRPLRLKLSDDVAMAPPPCVVSLNADATTGKPNARLAYYAYNPNAQFKRSNPGIPDFGVAVMPFHSDTCGEPTFDTLASLVSMCEGEKEEEHGGNASGGIPLRLVTVSDGGAVIAFGVTEGDVPSINKQNNHNMR